MPALESRRVRTQPLTVIAASFGASPAKMLRTSNVLLFTIKAITKAGRVFLTFYSHRASLCTEVVIAPIREISDRITSPGLIGPTPSGVPVNSTSPGIRV